MLKLKWLLASEIWVSSTFNWIGMALAFVFWLLLAGDATGIGNITGLAALTVGSWVGKN